MKNIKFWLRLFSYLLLINILVIFLGIPLYYFELINLSDLESMSFASNQFISINAFLMLASTFIATYLFRIKIDKKS